jgi:hypothetical protein
MSLEIVSHASSPPSVASTAHATMATWNPSAIAAGS